MHSSHIMEEVKLSVDSLRSIESEDMKNMYIANFVPFEYAKNIITEYEYESASIFALRSLRSCRLLEVMEGDTKLGDSSEGHATYMRKGREECNFESGATIMVSCWTIIENDYVTIEDWMDLYEKGGKDKFARTDGIAIVSTVNKVESFLENNNAYFFLGKKRLFKHGRVEYPPEPKELPENYDGILDPAFEKKVRYEYQREYRFEFALDSRYPLEKVTYCVNPKEYIDKIQFGPEMKCQNTKKLLRRACGAFVQLLQKPDFDELHKVVRCPLIKFQEDQQ